MTTRIVTPPGIKEVSRISRQLVKNHHKVGGNGKPRIIRPDTFNQMIATLRVCADNDGGCVRCPYEDKCVEQFDFICGRVIEERKRIRNDNRI